MLKEHLSGCRVITPQRSVLRQKSLSIFINDLDTKNGSVLNVITSTDNIQEELEYNSGYTSEYH